MISEFPWDDLWICFEGSQHLYGQGAPHHGVKGALLMFVGLTNLI
jgi:hypothetical protein